MRFPISDYHTMEIENVDTSRTLAHAARQRDEEQMNRLAEMATGSEHEAEAFLSAARQGARDLLQQHPLVPTMLARRLVHERKLSRRVRERARLLGCHIYLHLSR